MEKKIDYQAIDTLQDSVLRLVMALENDFYLTGGTALHRFYCHKRYSIDLDFFVSNSPRFYEDFGEIVEALRERQYRIGQEVSFRDFYRLRVNDLLQVDFVNDRVYRYGKSNIIEEFRIDNPINILANKITALVSRDEEKDVFDICCCALTMEFNWGSILEIANKKATVEKETVIYRLSTFPLKLLRNIHYIEPVEISPELIDALCQDIEDERDNKPRRDPV